MIIKIMSISHFNPLGCRRGNGSKIFSFHFRTVGNLSGETQDYVFFL